MICPLLYDVTELGYIEKESTRPTSTLDRAASLAAPGKIEIGLCKYERRLLRTRYTEAPRDSMALK